MTHSEKVMRIQADKLANLLGYPPNTFFEIAELKAIEAADPGTEITFRGKKLQLSPTMKATANVLLHKVQQ